MEATNTKLLSSIKELSDYKFAIDQASIIAVTDTRGVITYVNKKFEEISQYDSSEILGQNHRMINSNHHPKPFWVEMWSTISNGKVWNGEIRNSAKDGSIYWVNTTIVPFLDNNQKPYQFMAIRTDITDKKNALLELEDARMRAIHAEKMASLGELAASVAHELGNPVGAVLSWLQIVSDCLNRGQLEDAELEITLPKIQKRTRQMQDIIRGMLTFARDGSKDPLISLNLAAVIKSVSDYMASKLTKNQITLDLANINKSLYCPGRETEMFQVFFNLLSNALDAIKELDEEKWIKLELTNDEKYALFRITDSGKGIPKALAANILDPFFTTKPSGKGTGLGLSISRSIITELGGTISYEFHSGRTSFLIKLPL